MILSWLEGRRRRKILSSPFPRAWLGHLRNNVRHYSLLSESEQGQLRDAIRVFIADKSWEGCGGLRLTDEIKVTIAAQACFMILNLPGYYFDKVRTILVYPLAYMVPGARTDRYGLVHDGPLPIEGQSWANGTVILSWEEARKGGRNAADGRNLVFHEFAHQLDGLDGQTGGIPPLPNRASERRWHAVMTEEFARLGDDADHGRVTLLDQYGATNEAEFFAVATECFFERPVEMARTHPRLFEILRDFYRRAPEAVG
jgi:MtfA peptidase